MKSVIKNLTISLSVALAIPAISMAGDESSTGYQSLESARQALSTHLSSPSSQTDPFALSGQGIINYVKEQNTGILREESYSIIDEYKSSRTTLLSQREEWVRSEQELLAAKLSEAIGRQEDGEDIDVAALYDEYRESYSNNRDNEFVLAKVERIVSIIDIGDSQSNMNRDSVNAHRTSVNNLLTAYNEKRIELSGNHIDTDLNERIANFSNLNSKVETVIAKAADFNSECPACQMPDIPVFEDPAPPVEEEVEDPTPVYIPGDDCSIDSTRTKYYYKDPYILYKCP